MAAEWYYSKGDQRIGPVSESDLKSLAESGQLTAEDLVRQEGLADWQPASKISGLFPSTPTTTSTSVPPPLPQSPEAAHAEAPAVGADFALNAKKQMNRAAAAMSTFMSTAKSAAQLAAKQTEKTKLTTITLRSVYRPLGKHCYESQEYRADFPDLFGQLDAIQHELATLAAGHTEQPSSQSFGDKAKAMAGKVTQAAQSQKLSMQQSSVFGALGKAVYEAHGEASGPSSLTAPIAASLSRLGDLDADISRLSSEGKGSWITPKRLAIVGAVAACLFVMAVVGSLGTNQSKTTTKGDTLQNVSATDLYAAFKNDPEAADKKYKGKWLAVSGQVGTRDNAPKNHPGTIMMGLTGSSDTDAYIACYFAPEDEPMLQLLNSTPQPPIIGKCLGAAQSEYGKAGQTLIEVQLRQCNILPVASAKPQSPSVAQSPKKQASSPYDSGFSEGYSAGKHNTDQYKQLPDPSNFSGPEKGAYEQQRKNYVSTVLRRTLKSYDDIFKLKAANREQVGEEDYQRCKGMVEGYRKALREAGFSL